MRCVWIVALAIGAFLAGCGGSLSAQDLRHQAGDICKAAGQKSQGIPAPSSPSQTAPFLQRGLAALNPEVSQLRSLQPDPGQATDFHAAVGALQRELKLVEQTIRELQRGGSDPVIALKGLQQQLAPLESEADGHWRALEIPACVTR